MKGLYKIDFCFVAVESTMWYGKEHLNPTRTKALVKKWDAPPGNSSEHYYDLFPHLYPYFLPDDHYIVKYDETKYPRHRDYRTFKSAPKPIKSKHQIEWEDGYGACNVCEECKGVAAANAAASADYYRRLTAWRETGEPM